jgi:Arginine repressor, DNA binding domain
MFLVNPVAKNSTRQQEINRRRQIVSKLRHEGVKAQADIVERLLGDYGIEVSQQTVSLDLKALDQLWRGSALNNTDKWKREVAEQYRYLYQQSLAAWELSLEDAEESTTGGKDGPSEKVKGQSGNPAHIRNAQEALKAMREMLGLDAKQAVEMDLPSDSNFAKALLSAYGKNDTDDQSP